MSEQTPPEADPTATDPATPEQDEERERLADERERKQANDDDEGEQAQEPAE